MRLDRAERNKTVANRNAGKSFKILTLGSWTSAVFHTIYFLKANQAATHCCLLLDMKALHLCTVFVKW